MPEKTIPEIIADVKKTINTLRVAAREATPESVDKLEACAEQLADKIEALSKFKPSELSAHPEEMIGLSANLNELSETLSKERENLKGSVAQILQQIKARRGYGGK